MWVVVVVAAFLSGQTAEGEGEGEGVDPCAPSCVDETHLSFCDDGEAVTLDCAVVDDGARCALLSDAWGADCLLPEGAVCDPGYALAESRCDEGMSCIDGVCAVGEPVDEPLLLPTPGTIAANDTSNTTSTTGCASSGGAPAVLVALALVLWPRRRRR